MKAKKILCYSPYNSWQLHGLYEITILHALNLRGAEIKHVLCDGVFKACDIHWEATNPRHDKSCEECQIHTSYLSKQMGMPFDKLSNYITETEYKLTNEFTKNLHPEKFESAIFKSWNIGEWVKSSVHSHFRINKINVLDEKVSSAYLNYIESGILVAHGMSRLIEKFKPDILFIFSGRLSTLRVALEVAKDINLETYLHERGTVYDTVNIWKNSPKNFHQLKQYKSYWKYWKDVQLTPSQKDETINLLKAFQKGKGSSWKSFVTTEKIGSQKLINEFNINTAKQVWTIFTSSTDEIAADERNEVFGNQMTWIEETIRIAIKRQKILLIRIHPNVASKVSNGINKEETQYFIDIKHKYKDQDNYIKFIDSDCDINTYDLVDITNVAITYGSTIGLEMACMGKNVVVCAESFYDCLRNIWVVRKKEVYEDLLCNAARIENKNSIKDEALKFAHFYYFAATSIKFPLVKMTDPHNAVLNYSSLNELLPGKDENLDRICDYILFNKDIVKIPNIGN